MSKTKSVKIFIIMLLVAILLIGTVMNASGLAIADLTSQVENSQNEVNEVESQEKVGEIVESNPTPEIPSSDATTDVVDDASEQGKPVIRATVADTITVTTETDFKTAITNPAIKTINVGGTSDINFNALVGGDKSIVIQSGACLRLSGNSSGNVEVAEGGKLKLFCNYGISTLQGTLVNNGTVEKIGANGFAIQSNFTNTGTVTLTAGKLSYDYGKLTNTGTIPVLSDSFICNIGAVIGVPIKVDYATSLTTEDKTIETGDTVYLTFSGFAKGITRDNIGAILNTTWKSGIYGDTSENVFEMTATSDHVGEGYRVNSVLKTGYRALHSLGSSGMGSFIKIGRASCRERV